MAATFKLWRVCIWIFFTLVIAQAAISDPIDQHYVGKGYRLEFARQDVEDKPFDEDDMYEEGELDDDDDYTLAAPNSGTYSLYYFILHKHIVFYRKHIT